MKKKFLSMAFVAALFGASASLFVSCKDYDDDINSVSSRLDQTKTDLASLVETKVATVTSQVDALKAQVAALESAQKDAKNQLDAAIAAAQKDANAYAEQQAAQAQKAAIDAAEASLKAAVAALQGSIDVANAKIEAANKEIANQGAQISNLLAADKELQNAIVLANAEIATCKNLIEKNATDIKNVSDNLTKVQNDLQSQISLLGEKLDKTIADVAANKAAADAEIVKINALIESTNAALVEADGALAVKIAANADALAKLANELAAHQVAAEAQFQAAEAATTAAIADLKAQFGVEIEAVNAEIFAAYAVIEANQAEFEEFVAAQEAENEAIAEFVNELAQSTMASFLDAKADVAAVKAHITEIEDMVFSNGLSIKNLQTSVANINAALENKLEVSVFEAFVADYKAYVASNDAAIQAIEEQVAAEFTRVNEALMEITLGAREDLAEAVATLNATIGTKTTDLQAQLDALKTQIGLNGGDEGTVASVMEIIEALSARVDATEEEIEANAGDIQFLRECLEDVRQGAQVDLAELDARVEAAFLVVNSDLEDVRNNVKAELASINTSMQQAVSVLQSNIDDVKAAVKALEDDMVAELQLIREDISDVRDNAKAAINAVKEYAEEVEDKVDAIFGIATKQVKSLVYNPAYYWQGIEAIAVKTYHYSPIVGFDAGEADVTKDQSYDAPQRNTRNWVNATPNITASYYVNPSNAEISTDVANYKFISAHAQTRAIADDAIEVKKVERNLGKINVTFDIANAQNICGGDEAVDVVALTYTYASKNKMAGGDTTVVSDFAALMTETIDDIRLNRGNKDVHLLEFADDAINDVANAIKVVWNTKDGVNLDNVVKACYTVAGNHVMWGGQSVVNKDNFEIKYELIGYIVNTVDQTNESAHAYLKDGKIFMPKANNGDELGRQIIGRRPLVRVTLVDNNNEGAIVTAGYLLFEIVAENSVPMEVEADAIENGYTVACEDDIALNKQVITWAEVESKVLAELQMSSIEFESIYSLELDGTVAKQYKKSGNSFSATSKFGKVTEFVATEGTETKVLKWEVTQNEAYNNFVTSGKNTVSRYIKFLPEVAGKYPEIYIKITWTPNAINKTPKATIENSWKKQSAWYEKNTINEGTDELHMNCGDGTVDGAVNEFRLICGEKFYNDVLAEIKKQLKGTYGKLANNTSISYEFAPKSEQTNKEINGKSISLKNNNTEIWAGGEKIATIDTSNGEIVVNEPSTNWRAALNSYGEDLSIAPTFTVKIVATTCEPADELIKLDNAKFDVKTIRPIDITAGTVSGMIFGKGSTYTQNASLSFIDFKKFTPVLFKNYSQSGADSFQKFYGITGIAQNGDILTDYAKAGSFKAVDPADFSVTYTPDTLDILDNKFGTVTLSGVSANCNHKCKVQIPLTITYAQGTIDYVLEFTIEATAGGNGALN